MLYKVDAIVLRAMDYGESDKIITLFTREQGKVAVIVRGAHKPNSRLNVVTQVFTHGTYIYFRGRTANLAALNQGEVIQHFATIYSDLDRTAYAAYLVELVERVLESDQANEALYDQLLAALEQMGEGKDPEVVARIFEMVLFRLMGYLPGLAGCAVCASERDLVAFSISRGGLVCSLHLDPTTIVLSAAAVKLLRVFSEMDLRRLGEVSLRPETREELRKVTEAFCDQYIDVRLKSRGYLDLLRDFDV